jgi:hypothetical protein
MDRIETVEKYFRVQWDKDYQGLSEFSNALIVKLNSTYSSKIQAGLSKQNKEGFISEYIRVYQEKGYWKTNKYFLINSNNKKYVEIRISDHDKSARHRGNVKNLMAMINITPSSKRNISDILEFVNSNLQTN